MENMFNTRPIYTVALEHYIGYHDRNFRDKSKEELIKYLKSILREINGIEKELEMKDKETLTYIQKEKLANAKHEFDQIKQVFIDNQWEFPKKEDLMDNPKPEKDVEDEEEEENLDET